MRTVLARTVAAGVIAGAALIVPQTSSASPAHHPTPSSVQTVPGHAAPPADPVFPRGLPSAPTEEGCYVYRCVWDAKRQGNGRGHSLILTRWQGDFIAQRISDRRAHRLHVAYCARPNVECVGYEY